jgi:hypothetical protein
LKRGDMNLKMEAILCNYTSNLFHIYLMFIQEFQLYDIT